MLGEAAEDHFVLLDRGFIDLVPEHLHTGRRFLSRFQLVVVALVDVGGVSIVVKFKLTPLLLCPFREGSKVQLALRVFKKITGRRFVHAYIIQAT